MRGAGLVAAALLVCGPASAGDGVRTVRVDGGDFTLALPRGWRATHAADGWVYVNPRTAREDRVAVTVLPSAEPMSRERMVETAGIMLDHFREAFCHEAGPRCAFGDVVHQDGGDVIGLVVHGENAEQRFAVDVGVFVSTGKTAVVSATHAATRALAERSRQLLASFVLR